MDGWMDGWKEGEKDWVDGERKNKRRERNNNFSKYTLTHAQTETNQGTQTPWHHSQTVSCPIRKSDTYREKDRVHWTLVVRAAPINKYQAGPHTHTSLGEGRTDLAPVKQCERVAMEWKMLPKGFPLSVSPPTPSVQPIQMTGSSFSTQFPLFTSRNLSLTFSSLFKRC